MRRTLNALVIVFAIALLAGSAQAVTIHVPSEQATIQDGIDAASTGDTVLVAANSYTGALNRDLDFGGKGIVLESEDGPAWTSINCEYSGRGFLFNSGEDTTSVVRGFAVWYAVADSGAGAYCTNGSSPKFEDCSFWYCEAGEVGGALCCNASSPILRGCYLKWNTAGSQRRQHGRGGGLACIAGSSPVISDVELVENEALDMGGGFYSHSSTPTLVDCEFVSNTLGDYGNGGGAAVSQSAAASFTDCLFVENGVYTCVGGGVYSSGSTLSVTDCDFMGNISGACGGIHLTGSSYADVSGCVFVGNEGAWSAAGAMQCVNTSDATVSNCTFVQNRRHHVWCDKASPTLEYRILAFSTSGLPVYCEHDTETPHVHHCFVYGNADGDTLCGGNFHDIEYADPRLCDFPSGDVTLCADSECLPGETWPQLVGAEDQGCDACGSPVEERTWGRIKAIYR